MYLLIKKKKKISITLCNIYFQDPPFCGGKITDKKYVVTAAHYCWV